MPIYSGEWRGAPLSIAAYTEPSVVWERTNPQRLARSWNLMASGECLASLEDAESRVCHLLPGDSAPAVADDSLRENSN